MNVARQSCEQHLPQNTGRVPFWDVLKFFAILSVVYGHVSGAFGCKMLEPYISNFRIGMNMPLFFVISGYFAAKTIEKGDWRKFGFHLVGYFWPLATVSIVFTVLSVLFHVKGSECGFIGYAVRRFLFAGWFFWCLALCFGCVFLCRRIASGWKYYLLLSTIYCVLLIDIPFWHIGNMRAMLPFFIVGLILARSREVWKDWRIGFPCLGVYCSIAIFQGDIWENGLSFYNSPISWLGIMGDIKVLALAGIRFINGLIGCIGVCWIMHALLTKCTLLERLAPLGMTTLGVYVLHQWILARIPAREGWLATCAVTCFLFAVCHLITLLTNRIPFVRKWFWGVFL